MVLRRISGGWDKAGDRGRAVALALTAAAGLAACSSTPKYVNPVELYRSAAGFTLNDDTTGERNAQNLEAGRNQPYPNLGTVPPPPDRAMSSIDRQKLQQGLADDRAQAKQSDADLRASRGAAAGAPTPITRPSSATDGAAPTETKRNADPSLVGERPEARSARRRSPSGSEPAPQETALNSPIVHAMPEGDTPRPAPPPPSLPPPEKARKSAADQAAKSSPAPTTAKRPSPAPQTAAADLPRPTASPADARPPRSPSPADAAKAETTPAAAPTPATPSTAPADQAMRIPPPPPADMMMPAPDKTAAAEPARPAPPVPLVAAPAEAPKAAAAPAAPADTVAPAAPWPPPLGPSDTEKSPPEQIAALDPVRPPLPAAAPAPTAANTPEQQAALEPPPRQSRPGSVSMQAAEIKFAGSGLTLTPDDDRRLADVVKLYDKHGGVVRIVGYGRRGYGADAAQQELASFSKAIERANVVAKALTQLGLASNRIIVQAAPIGDGLGEDRAEVLLEF